MRKERGIICPRRRFLSGNGEEEYSADYVLKNKGSTGENIDENYHLIISHLMVSDQGNV